MSGESEEVDLSENQPMVVEEVRRVLPHKRFGRYMERLCDAFGWRYTAMACIVYGANGTGEAFIGGAESYYFFDIQGVSAARFTQITSFARIPWEIKALYGMTSDTVSFCGLRRTPYVIMAGCFGAVAGFGLWSMPLNVLGASAFLTLVQFSVALSDVMIDGSSGEKAHVRPDMASDLQAVMHSASYLVGFVADVLVGYLVDPQVLGSRGVFALFIISSLSTLTPAAFGWMSEDQSDEAVYDVGRMIGVYKVAKPGSSLEEGGNYLGKKNSEDNKNPMTPLEEEEGDEDLPRAEFAKEKKSFEEESAVVMSVDDEIAQRVRGPIFVAAVMNSLLSFILGVTNLLYDGNSKVAVLGSLTIIFGVVMASILYVVLSPVSMDLAKAAIYIFLEGAFHPSTSVVFQWSHSDGDKGGNCSGNCDSYDDDDCGWARSRDYPCISPAVWGWARATSRIFGLVGVILYSTCFSNWRYREIFYFGHCVYFVANMLDLIWVTRTNILFGINDELFLFGSEIIQPVLRKLHTMPILILSAKLCPKSVEATLFALMMGVWNFGSSLGKYNGVALLYIFGGVDAPEFKNLEPFIFVRTMMYLGPIVLTYFFSPSGGPNDHDYYKKKNDDLDDLDDVDKALKATKNTEIELTHTKRTSHDKKKQVYAQVGHLSSSNQDQEDTTSSNGGVSAGLV